MKTVDLFLFLAHFCNLFYYYFSKTDDINLEIAFSRSNANLVHCSSCAVVIESPPGLFIKHNSPLHIPIVIKDAARSSSSPSGSASKIFL